MIELTPAQIAQYHEDGFLIVDKIIEPEAAADILEKFEAVFDGSYETGVKPDEVNLPVGDPPYTKQICNAWKSDLTVARHILSENLGRACAQLAGWDGTRLMIDNLLWKPPAGRSIGFHQDSMYSLWIDKPALVSCWVALGQTTAEGGTLVYIKGSHKWGQAKPIMQFHGPDDDLKEVREWAEANDLEIELVPVVVPPGGGAFHDGWLWHGSRINKTENSRKALAAHFFQHDIEFNPDLMKIGNGPIYGKYKRFGSNEVDESYFPITYRDDGYRTPGLDEFIQRGVI
ncbi:phytanoyl-CoA dioxygenase family protein [Neptuniibacter sp. CAU 1671]|uniref:phytanoyl-CoA dioxygenase family protein n=1 Tax=Neptuniibacter sp. CAU 1671 TaxID=3032593 RepID=UPI0023DBB04F|nr:phytanoyl-CoA dioxygenase family protein [Neptuniibacter sp. CAU 1671]MDF2180948.1 phytanoyl-CoA dioxygenase family protein [Neptuniibacter sp. CAU 1671]